MRAIADLEAFREAWSLYQTWGELVTRCIAERRGVPPSDFATAVDGRMIWAAVWTAQVAWAATEEERPDAFLHAAIRNVGGPCQS